MFTKLVFLGKSKVNYHLSLLILDIFFQILDNFHPYSYYWTALIIASTTGFAR